MKKIILKASILSILGGIMPLAARALTVDPNLGGTLGLGTAELTTSVIYIIQWVLGLLGLIAVIMIIVGGFKWMTAGGDEEKIESAKKLLTAAVIGLVIVLLAWAIVIFVAGALNNATNT